MIRLALQSLGNRHFTALLTIFAIGLSVALLLAVDKLRQSARDSFTSTISGTDLIAGARAGDIQLLLYAVFRMGEPTGNMTWQSYEDIAARREVKWIVPISLGDSHRSFRVVGTNADFFAHYAYRSAQKLSLEDGALMVDLFDVVIGAEVAQRLGYNVGDPVVVTHGLGQSGTEHDDLPFRISGILARTGTPVDRALYVSLEAIEAIHVGWQGGGKIPGLTLPEDRIRAMDLKPKEITAALIGLNSRIQAFSLQRAVNDYEEEALTAILPGVALTRLWSLVGIAEKALLAVSFMVVVAALLGMAAMLLATLGERRREMAILRANGANPRTIGSLLVFEAALLAAAGVVLGLGLMYLLVMVARPLLEARFGLAIPASAPQLRDGMILLGIVFTGALVGLIPAVQAYRRSLADGLTVRS